MSVVEDFINRYIRECDYYREVARICARQCEVILEQNGIRAIVTYRTKRPDRLRQKIEKRNRRKRYETTEEISRDIKDLAGVRIALYFPRDHDQVSQLIQDQFECEEIKILPGDKRDSSLCRRFTGYRATHYRVGLRPETLPDPQARYALTWIEIQVASVLMLAWAEVDHDLRYKQFQGALSQQEHLILDELAGIVLAGEQALERLQKTTADRANKESITNHYELAAYLHQQIQNTHRPTGTPVVMGRTDVLFEFLQMMDAVHPGSIAGLLPGLDLERPIVRQLVDRALFGDAGRAWLYLQAKRRVEARKPCGCVHLSPQSDAEKQATRFFLSNWAALETIIHHISASGQLDHISQVPIHSEAIDGPLMFWGDTRNDFKRVQDHRDDLLFGLEPPSTAMLVQAGESLSSMLEKNRPLIPEDIWQLARDSMTNARYSGGEGDLTDAGCQTALVTEVQLVSRSDQLLDLQSQATNALIARGGP